MTKYITPTISIFYCLTLCYILVYGINKGFDFRDEAYHLLLVENPADTTWKFQYQHFLNQWFDWLNPGIIGYRFIRLVLTFLSAGVLYKGIRAWMEHLNFHLSDITQKVFLACYLLLSSLIGYSTHLRSLNYNALTFMCLTLVFGLLLQAFYKKNISSITKHAFILLIGILLAFLFFAKFSSSILLSFFVIITLGLFHFNDKANMGKSFIALLIGAGLLFGYYHLFIHSLFDWYVNLVYSLEVQLKMSRYSSVSHLIVKYFFDTFRLLSFKLPFYALIFIPFILSYSSYNYLKQKTTDFANARKAYIIIVSTSVLLILGSYLLLLPQFRSPGFFFAIHVGYYLLIMLSLFSILATCLYVQSKQSFIQLVSQNSLLIVLFLLLLLIPYIGAVGTSNNINNNITAFLVSWFVIIYILSKYLGRFVDIRLLPLLFTTATLTICFFQCYKGANFLFLTKGNLHNQTATIDFLPKARNLYIHPQQKKYIGNAHRILTRNIEDYEKHPMITAGESGLAYLLDARIPGNPWYTYSQEASCYKLKLSSIEDLSSTIFFSYPRRPFNTKFLTCLHEKGINYPEEYQAIGRIKHFSGKRKFIIEVPKKLLPKSKRKPQKVLEDTKKE